MDTREIAMELAVACLGHDKFAVHFEPPSTKKADATDAGERVGEFYNAIWKALLKELSASSKESTVHQV